MITTVHDWLFTDIHFLVGTGPLANDWLVMLASRIHEGNMNKFTNAGSRYI